MGNNHPSQDNATITIRVRASSYYRLENVPQWVPFIKGGYRIDQRVWDEFYGHVMSCETCPDIEKMRIRHTCNFALIIICGILWAVGIILIMAGALTILINEEFDSDWWWDTTTTSSNHPNSDSDSDIDYTPDIIMIIIGFVLLIIGLIGFIVSIRSDRKNRQKWMNHVRTQLSIKLRYLNAKYDGKVYFILDQFSLRITIEVKVPNVIFIPDAPQYQAPIGGTGTNENENQGLIVNEAPVSGNGDGNGNGGFIDVQMPDGNIVKCKIVSQGGGMANYGSANVNEMNQPLINEAGEGNESERITMK